MNILNKLKNREIDQLILRVGKKCNFKCLFCNVGNNEKRIKDKFTKKELIKEFFFQLSKGKFYNKEILISISGGEPTLFKDEVIFISRFMYKYFKTKGIKLYLELQTNASFITYEFIKELKKYGLVHVLVSFHTINKNSYRKLIGIDYDKIIGKVLSGIDIVEKNNILISFNIIFTKINYKDINKTIIFLIKKFPNISQYNIGYFQPNGYGETNYEKLYIDFNKVIPYYKKAIKILEKSNKDILSHFTGLPLCILGEYKKYSLEYNNNLKLREKKTDNYSINFLNRTDKIFLNGCYTCVYNSLCDGVWKNFGTNVTIKPIEYNLVFFNGLYKTLKKHFLILNNQVIISSFNKNLESNIFKFMSDGVPKISLFIETDSFNLSQNYKLGFNNVQFFLKSNINNYKFILKNIDFFEKNKINIDIFIDMKIDKKYFDLIKEYNFIRFIV